LISVTPAPDPEIPPEDTPLPEPVKTKAAVDETAPLMVIAPLTVNVPDAEEMRVFRPLVVPTTA
jgi:hypothetical protein